MLRRFVEQLIARGTADEALGVWRPEKKLFGVPRPPVIDPVGRAWRLGVLLIDREGALFATGHVTRAIVPRDFNSDKTLAGDERREIQRAAARGSFRAGETVNYGWLRLDVDVPQHPLAVIEGVPHVTDGATVPLDAYLRARVDLLLG